MIEATRELLKENVDKKLIRRMQMFLVIVILIAGMILYDVIVGKIGIGLALLGVASGTVVGFAVGRMFNIKWHHPSKQVVAQLDTLGIIILVIYIGFSIARHWFFARWFHGSALTAFTFSFIGGAMAGRLLSMGLNIRRVLTERGIVE